MAAPSIKNTSQRIYHVDGTPLQPGDSMPLPAYVTSNAVVMGVLNSHAAEGELEIAGGGA